MASQERLAVLMVDDDPEAPYLMGLRLNEACQADLRFSLESAETLQRGLERLAAGSYDVLLLDLNLPDSRGLDTLRAAKAKAGETPIVVLTGLQDEAAGIAAIAQGAQDYLFKDRLDIALLRRSLLFAVERAARLRDQRELEALRAEIRERRKADIFKDRLLAAVSHELRSPLTVAQTAVTSLDEGRAGRLSRDQQELAEIARRNLERLGRLVLNVLDFSRLESGRATVRSRRVDLRRLIAELAGDWKHSLQRPLSLEVDLPKDLPAVRADADLLAQVLYNLLDNAARHARSSIRIAARMDGATARLTVEDDGPGVPTERANDLFEPFTQLARASGPGYKGAGLGLAICRQIAHVLGGRIWLDRSAATVARFHFEVPKWTAALRLGAP